ncbi:t(6)A37 threonylcarbamoyladenosine biosynthesis protein [Thalassovita gelatinovora]|uniref:T(6)A37 threonylcarbamoyladenosine biosynthesis protein n=1 Tax=Thalassovita gelatinovora TaxID=53501 RepID=A0A0P1FCF6_THAGE|nr:tRNA (adenosine(37)-N6)-threonylcarbamoyltransferase complex dimerization subunit type 1 TsaB [Thalassovita gelatinovora]QIZ80476.1 tRNA (adenosine(37)-N6)-threonylcarbamoyltransferase complex dimerization subunit type 1 TsaB [Thalassovita gelatinovora]CUH65912.1 t(6)A37 threonylcarbamoyladenosine biosynthesis protein [Thalassovita gelatinovora]SEQ73611.1 tRNA threonylcarbamoyl adenosine modification protein YeaZ [Thalassovita gelatinovora]
MPSDPLVLAFDTSAAHCAAALLSGDAIIITRSEDMGRGQAERLMPLLEEVLAEAGKDWTDLNAIGVGTGPGNFTGIRISVSAARGLALALDVPAIGVTTFAAISLDHDAPHIPIVPAPRDQLYIAPDGEPARMVAREDADLLDRLLCAVPSSARLVENIARIVSATYSEDAQPPAPLYIKAADAAPPRDPAPVILTDDR